VSPGGPCLIALLEKGNIRSISTKGHTGEECAWASQKKKEESCYLIESIKNAESLREGKPQKGQELSQSGKRKGGV